MNYEEKINELEERIHKLEKKEKKRTIAKFIKIGIKLVVLIVICVFVYKAYLFVKPYKEKLDNLSKIEEKVTSGTENLKGVIDKFNIFGN